MINRKKLIFVVIIVIVVYGTYFFFLREDNYVENINSLNVYENLESNVFNNEDKKKDKIVVYIVGAIENEGLYELEENSRIADVIELAGGLTKEADISDINLAVLLEDGVKIVVPRIGENNKNENNVNLQSAEEVNDFKSSSYINKDSKSTQNKININIATQNELETLPGIGSSTAIKIINYRKENGKFKNIDEIKKVKGIGESKYNKIKDLIKV